MRSSIALCAVVAICAGSSLAQPVLQPPFDNGYTFTDLGSPVGVPANLGGLVIKADDPGTLLIGGAANGPNGALYAVSLVRNAEGHITGFAGPAVHFASAQYNDGGVAYGPGGVLFLARWPVNELGQLRPGSVATDRVIGLGTFGVPGSHSALNFVPPGFPGAGRMKLTTYAGGSWFDVSISPDGNGTYNVDAMTNAPASTLPGAPEGFTYVPQGSQHFTQPSMLLSEFGSGAISTFELNAVGDPVISSRRVVLTGLTGAEGAATDPLTGDFLFSTFGGGSRVVVISGFNRPPCDADFNLDGFVNPDDLADYITCFFLDIQFPGFCPSADYNGDDFRDPDDLADFITVFFTGDC